MLFLWTVYVGLFGFKSLRESWKTTFSVHLLLLQNFILLTLFLAIKDGPRKVGEKGGRKGGIHAFIHPLSSIFLFGLIFVKSKLRYLLLSLLIFLLALWLNDHLLTFLEMSDHLL